ncbi:hypothetical protein [Streptomyces sp. NPDC101166]
MADPTRLCRSLCWGSGGRPPGRHGMRRLAEKPANLCFFARSMVTKG